MWITDTTPSTIDAALARVTDPLQPFLIVDAKLLADHILPDNKRRLRLPLIASLDLTRSRFADNLPAEPVRWAVKHRRDNAAGYYAGQITITNLNSASNTQLPFSFNYAETPQRDLFMLQTPLLVDQRIRSQSSAVIKAAIKRPDAQFSGADAVDTFAYLLGQPWMREAFRPAAMKSAPRSFWDPQLGLA